MPYPHLLTPLRVGRLELRNRVVMGSMHMRLGFDGNDAVRLAAFYAERARGGVAMIVTGGVAPNAAGRMEDDAAVLAHANQLEGHQHITSTVRQAGAACVMQILHAGRYARHAQAVGPSDAPSPINPGPPHRLTANEIEATIADYVRCALLAQRAGYHGVDIMGSEGYLLNQFVALRTNDRDDEWGGPLENRMRLPLEIVRRVRARVGPDFLILYRLSAIDLVEGGATAEETLTLARQLEAAGTDALCTGIGWHESRVPTIAYPVPRGAWRFAAARLKRAVTIPVIASNRINTAELAEAMLAEGDADLVALARPLLADPDFVAKARAGSAHRITPCIACNQACLDFIFTNRSATCLVNPRAGHELDYRPERAVKRQRIAVAGAGPAGIAFAIAAATRGHEVALFESGPRLGGQFDLARHVPGKEEFGALLAHYEAELRHLGVSVLLSTPLTASHVGQGYDRVVVATGVSPRKPDIPGIDLPHVAFYPEVLQGAVVPGRRVVIVGSGAIAWDVAEYLTSAAGGADVASFHRRWGVDTGGASAGGLLAPTPEPSTRTVHLLQRRTGRPAAALGISTGWILRTRLMQKHVTMLTGCAYSHIDARGLHYTVNGEPQMLEADTIVICAGQEPQRGLAAALQSTGLPIHVIGGARDAAALDARRAILEGYELGVAC